MTRFCPECGHPAPINKIAESLPGKQRRLYEIVQAAGTEGLSRNAIIAKLYEDDPEGGPITENILSAHAYHVNVKIKSFGVKISSRRGPGNKWKIRKIE